MKGIKTTIRVKMKMPIRRARLDEVGKIYFSLIYQLQTATLNIECLFATHFALAILLNICLD